MARKGKESKPDKFKSSELVGDSDSDEAVTAPGTNGTTQAATPTAEEDTDTMMPDVSSPLGSLDDSEEDAPVAAPVRKKATRRIASDDEDGHEQTVPQLDQELDQAEEKAQGNAFADGEDAPEPMVKETVGAAGDPDAADGADGGEAFSYAKIASRFDGWFVDVRSMIAFSCGTKVERCIVMAFLRGCGVRIGKLAFIILGL